MNTELITQHEEMVGRLAKPGEAILATLTAWDCNLTHMGGCLAGEASELYDALFPFGLMSHAEHENVLEELGDFEFYMVACRRIFKMERHFNFCKNDRLITSKDCVVELMRLAGHFWDVVKRAVVYRKPVETPKAVDILIEMEAVLNLLEKKLALTLEEILQANYTKLADKDKGRYASGTYSDAQAQARQDKVS